MEEHPCSWSCQAAAPYPPIQVEGRCGRYADMMLSNVGGSVSEMTAVALYLYDNLIIAELPEVAEVFRRIAVVEMRHLGIFGALTRCLGGDPRLWSRQGGRQTWWTPGYLSYTPKLAPLLRIALREERYAIQKYTRQSEVIRDRYVVANLRRVIQDEEIHVCVLEQLWDSYIVGGEGQLQS